MGTIRRGNTRPAPITRTQVRQVMDLFAPDDRCVPAVTSDGRPDGPRRAPKRQTERETVVVPILDYLTSVHIWRRRVFVGGIPLPSGGYAANPLRGMGDILALLPSGRAWSIECKAATVQSPWQINFQRDWTAAGGLYTLAHTVDDVRDALQGAIDDAD